MKLVKLLDIANEMYGDDILAQFYDETGKLTSHLDVDTLGLFIVKELISSYRPRATSLEQLHAAERAMALAKERLWDIQMAFDGEYYGLKEYNSNKKRKRK